MRIKEWYAFHFPELATHVPGLYDYVRCATVISDRKNFNEEVVKKLQGIKYFILKKSVKKF